MCGDCGALDAARFHVAGDMVILREPWQRRTVVVMVSVAWVERGSRCGTPRALWYRKPHASGALCVAVALGIASAANAQSASAQAETMFREGRTLLASGNVAEACAAFESSQQLEPAASTLINLAACRERNGQLATAWGLFVDVARATRDAANASDRTLHQVALDRAARLEPRLSRLTITVPAGNHPDGLEILRDTGRLEPAMWDRALPVDGGSYRITARAPGAVPWTTTIAISAERDSKTIEIPHLERAAAPPVVDASAAAPDSATTRGTGPTARRAPVVPIVVAGGGVLLLGGALGFALWGNSTYHAASTEQMDQARRDSLYRDANARRHVALGMAAGGVACGAVAAALYFTGRSTETDAPTRRRTRVSVLPMVGLAGTGTGAAVLGVF